MLWNTLKVIVIKWIEANPDEKDSQRLIQAAKAEDKHLADYIFVVNALNAELLRDVIPAAFPRHLRTGKLFVDQNNHGAWRVDALVKNGMPLKRNGKICAPQ